ncbi:DUF6377 domain-containing protein [Pontibacter sp. SGAir0037]|uniref:DUF6377 domain-containing protein n=1 Tax=Pontibacter sp. SGAir0037 TaxID=2571030 RepID=UPI0010F6BBB1|nr:DUF6377 domain-containing protein [Pontibacter sp. SGAir0037]
MLKELNITIKNKEHYIKAKQERIKKWHQTLQKANLTPIQQFDLYNKLYFEYRSFKYDSAYTYALKLQDSASQTGDSTRLTYATLKLSFTLLSSGMFKETFDSLNEVSLAQTPDSIKAEYYELMSRANFDLEAYNEGNLYSDSYITRGTRYIDSALALIDNNTIKFFYLRGMKSLKEKNYGSAEKDLELILAKFNPTQHEYAMVASLLAGVYKESGDTGKAIDMMIKAAIADIKSATREAIALLNVAELLYRTGDEARAYVYIKQALEDATFYGARQRKIQVAAILPIIEGERLATVESQRGILMIYAIAVSLLSLLVVIFSYIIFRQLKQLKLAKQTVTEANTSLQIANDKLKDINHVLQEKNEELLEANKIKEEYIGYSFNMYTEYLDKIEKLKKSIDKKVMNRRLDEISHVLESVDMKKEREDLYHSFDRVFIKLFPNFVTEFNSFFRDEDKVVLKDNQSLNIELRIFALIRIGINDHEQIAKILEYSVRTIYNYKTKVKSRSILSNEEFEDRIMEIKAF